MRRYDDDAALDAVHVTWAGSMAPGDPHYYRLQGPRLLAEWDDTQRKANHAHSVWRDPAPTSVSTCWPATGRRHGTDRSGGSCAWISAAEKSYRAGPVRWKKAISGGALIRIGSTLNPMPQLTNRRFPSAP